MIDNTELFFTSVYPDHLRLDSECSSHSYQHAFNETDDNITRNKFCVHCDIRSMFIQDMNLAIDGATLKPGEETIEELKDYFKNKIVVDMDIYIAHVTRKTFESENKNKIYNEMMDEFTALVVFDWKMKLMSLCSRESMVEYFGKRGINLLGMAFSRLKSAEEIELESSDPLIYRSQVKTDYIDLTTDEASEDAYNTFAIIILACKEYKRKNPHISKLIFTSDGALALKGCEMLQLVFNLNQYIPDLVVVSQIVSEAGCGKSHLDAHFCYIMIFLTRLVADGQGSNDIKNAKDVSRVLQLNGGVRNTTVHCVNVNRPLTAISPMELKGTLDRPII